MKTILCLFILTAFCFAQDVEKAGIPEATPIGKDGYYSFSDRAMIAALVNAVKEQQQEINMLKKKVGLK
jgi:hypothetical protein